MSVNVAVRARSRRTHGEGVKGFDPDPKMVAIDFTPAKKTRPAVPRRGRGDVDLKSKTIETVSINTIRALAMDAVQKANSGHPGTPMSMAPVAYTIYTKFLRHNPENPDWRDRDRFVLSAGHAS